MKKILLSLIVAGMTFCHATAQNTNTCTRQNTNTCTTQNMSCCQTNYCRMKTDSIARPQEVSPSTLIIYYEKSDKRILKAAKKIGAEIIYTYQNFNAVALRKPETWTLESTKEYFEKVQGVLQVSYDHVYHLD